MQLKILESMQNYNLELSFFQLIQLEVILENKVKELYANELDASREERILAKIYEISPTSKKNRIKSVK